MKGGWLGCSGVGAWSHAPKGCGFDPQSGHIQEATSRCFSPSPSLSNQYNTSSDEDEIKENGDLVIITDTKGVNQGSYLSCLTTGKMRAAVRKMDRRTDGHSL